MQKHGLEKESTGDSWAYNPRLRMSPAVGSKMTLSRRWFTGSVGLNPCRGARDHEYINEIVLRFPTEYFALSRMPNRHKLVRLASAVTLDGCPARTRDSQPLP